MTRALRGIAAIALAIFLVYCGGRMIEALAFPNPETLPDAVAPLTTSDPLGAPKTELALRRLVGLDMLALGLVVPDSMKATTYAIAADDSIKPPDAENEGSDYSYYTFVNAGTLRVYADSSSGGWPFGKGGVLSIAIAAGKSIAVPGANVDSAWLFATAAPCTVAKWSTWYIPE